MNLLTTLAQNSGVGLLPEAASTQAGVQDPLFDFIMALSAFFFVLIIAIMVLFAVKYRRRDPDQQPTSKASHSTALEIAWSLPPLVIVMIIFWVGLTGYVGLATPSANALNIDVVGKMWSWDFTYPNGYLDKHLHVVKDKPVELVITSSDVIHSVFVPAFRVKKDAVPGRYNKLYFTPTKAGVYDLYCTEYCGTSHSIMLSKVTVHETEAEFNVWLEEASRSAFQELDDETYEQWKAIESDEQFNTFIAELKASGDEDLVAKAEELKPPAVEGEALYLKHGCNTCHSIDGTRGTGPTWLGLWQNKRIFEDGSEGIADENYIRESILYPNAKRVANVSGVMASYQGSVSDREIDAIIAYIRTLKQ